jgi:starch-binding outer membrane protein, SusD/RagB family
MKSILYTIYKRLAIVFLLLASLATGCKKFVEIPPPSTELVTTNVFNNNSSATGALLNIYVQMVTGDESLTASEDNGLLADELTDYTGEAPRKEFYINAMNSTDINVNIGPWASAYNYIYQANAIITGLQTTSGASAAAKRQLTGEAYFIRAFWHFYLSNCYGGVPLALTTNYKITSALARTSRQGVLQQVVADLNQAYGLLNANYVDATDTAVTTEKVRPNKAVAAALLARAYLYAGDYSDAAKQATNVINNPLFALDTDPNSVFLTNSSEAIWQLQTPQPAGNGATADGTEYILAGAPTTVAISTQLLSAFELGDIRKTDWIGSYSSGGNTWYYPYKYKYNNTPTVYEYIMVLRLAEQYLIRAEAEAHLGDMQDAAKDLNIIRTRAGLAPSTILTANASMVQAQSAILHERQVELFTEWGHRWFDLARTGAINTVMGAPGNVTQFKGGAWNPNDALYPIPLSELKQDPNLTQNSGY